tara:strand:+ start:1184 stop:1465 length:282 start_codon:yes stop_codon:yes gene_type:complete
MSNLFTPQRMAGESFSAYQERRINGKRAAQAMTRSGPFKPDTGTSRKDLRDTQRRSGAMKKVAGSYGRGLRNWINNQNRAALAQRLAKKQAAA